MSCRGDRRNIKKINAPCKHLLSVNICRIYDCFAYITQRIDVIKWCIYHLNLYFIWRILFG